MILHLDNYDEDAPEYFENSMSGSTGWVVVSYGRDGAGVILDYGDRLGAMDYAVSVLGSSNAEELGIDYEGESETVKLWVRARISPDEMEFDVLESEVLWCPSREVEGLTRSRCTHRARFTVPPRDRGFRLLPDKTPPGWECVTCQKRESGAALDHLRVLILQRAANTCGGCGELYPDGGIHEPRKCRGEEVPMCYPCCQRRDHGILTLEVLEGRRFDWEAGAKASDHAVGDDGQVNWKAAQAADPGVVSCPQCFVYHWREGDLVSCAACHFEWRISESRKVPK